MTYDEACSEKIRIMACLEPVSDYEYRSTVLMLPESDDVPEWDSYFVCLAWYYHEYDDDGDLREYGNFFGLHASGMPVDELAVMVRRNYEATQQKLGF